MLNFPRLAAKHFSSIFCLGGSFLYLALVTSQYFAFHFSESKDLHGLEKAIRLNPWNSDYEYQLGKLLTIETRGAEAEAAFRRAVELNPNNAKYWLGFAAVSDASELSPEKRHALEQAVSANPMSPMVQWEAGNLFLAAGDAQAAYGHLRQAMEGDPTLSVPGVQLLWNSNPNADELIRNAIPPGAYSAFLNYLLSRNETAPAGKVWDRIVELRQPVKLSDVFDYVRYLIAQHQPAQAGMVWRQAGPLSGIQNHQPTAANLIVNGDLKSEILNGGFDWMYEQRTGVSIQLDPAQSHAGNRSLLISYDSSGLDDSGIQQLISVEPHAGYRFSAYFKTSQLEGAGGPRFTLQDFYTREPCFQSDDLKDSEDWKLVRGVCRTGPNTRLLTLQIKRVPTGNAIRGKLWLDEMAFAPVVNSSLEAPIH